ncbi:hypothetical protein D3C77_642510 [compost metagenome]
MNRRKCDADKECIPFRRIDLQNSGMHRTPLQHGAFLQRQMQQRHNIHAAYRLLLNPQHLARSPVHQNNLAFLIRRNHTIAHISQNRSELLLLFLVLGQSILQTARHVVERLA